MATWHTKYKNQDGGWTVVKVDTEELKKQKYDTKGFFSNMLDSVLNFLVCNFDERLLNFDVIASRVVKDGNNKQAEGVNVINGEGLLDDNWNFAKTLSRKEASELVSSSNLHIMLSKASNTSNARQKNAGWRREFGKQWGQWKKSKRTRNKIKVTNATGKPRQGGVSSNLVSKYVTIAQQQAEHDQAKQAKADEKKENKKPRKWSPFG